VAPRSKFAVVPLGLQLGQFFDLDPEPSDDFRAEIGAVAGETLFTYTGRLVPIKRPETMLRSLALASRRGAEVRVAVVGDGELRPGLERLARELGCAERVHFLGYRRDLVRIASGSDAALLTSANEGTPVALIEAAAASRPAVATRVGGVADIVVDGAGLLVPPGEVDAIAEAMVTIAADREARLRMGATAREHARARFTVERLIAQVESIYEELLAARGVAS
jgi:glycosyltransferase involved in cell wall biosynthesis